MEFLTHFKVSFGLCKIAIHLLGENKWHWKTPYGPTINKNDIQTLFLLVCYMKT